MKRRAKNRFEIDYLPPFGVPEVSLIGDVAMVAGLALTATLVLKKL